MSRMIKRSTILIATVGLIFCLTGCCSHDWIEANCTAPKTCRECGETEGEVAHSFKVLKCGEPVVCQECGIVGDIIDHTWAEATCDLPKTCEICSETEGSALGHSTRKGECERCEDEINEVAYKDGFVVVTYSDTTWMQKEDDFVDVYIVGMITEIGKLNNVTLVDSENGYWTIGVGTACDLSAYIGTECEVYGFSTGGISSQYKMPYVNMTHDDSKIIFADGKDLYPENYESTQQFTDKYFEKDSSEGSAWVPTDGGTKYHSKASCSSMYNPQKVRIEEAEASGFSKCGKCW